MYYLDTDSKLVVVCEFEMHALMHYLTRSETGRSLSSMFFKRGSVLEYIRVGSTFRCIHADKMVETAKVLSVGTDSFGIPHVRFQVSFRRPNQSLFDGGARLLALKSFVDHFTDRIAA